MMKQLDLNPVVTHLSQNVIGASIWDGTIPIWRMSACLASQTVMSASMTNLAMSVLLDSKLLLLTAPMLMELLKPFILASSKPNHPLVIWVFTSTTPLMPVNYVLMAAWTALRTTTATNAIKTMLLNSLLINLKPGAIQLSPARMVNSLMNSTNAFLAQLTVLLVTVALNVKFVKQVSNCSLKIQPLLVKLTLSASNLLHLALTMNTSTLMASALLAWPTVLTASILTLAKFVKLVSSL
jgi:hypothetical protein